MNLHSDNEFKRIFSRLSEDALETAKTRRSILRAVQDLVTQQDVTSNGQFAALDSDFRQLWDPEERLSFAEYADSLIAKVVQNSVNIHSSRCMGHMIGVVPSFVSPLAELLVALNQNLVKQDASPALTLLERQAIGMMHRFVYNCPDAFYAQRVQDPGGTLGLMAAGSTIGNITALWIARNRTFPVCEGFDGIEREGLAAAFQHSGCRGAVVIGSSLMHYSVDKAAALLGLGATGVIKVPVDRHARLNVSLARNVIQKCRSEEKRIVAIVGTAGTTDCGSVDPLSEIAALAQEFDLHFHVDAAWGAPLLFSEKHRGRLSGIEHADSVTVDGHKQMHLPVSTSMLLLRDPTAATHIEKEAPYMLQEGSSDLGKRSLEGSRGGDALFFHAALRVVGSKGYGRFIEHKISCAGEMAALIRNSPDFELLTEPETNIVLYRYLPIELRTAAAEHRLTVAENRSISVFNKQLQTAQYKAGHTFVSRTAIANRSSLYSYSIVALRAVITNPLVTTKDIEAVLQDQVDTAQQLRRNRAPRRRNARATCPRRNGSDG